MKKVLLLATSSMLAVPISFVATPVPASAQQITTEITGQVTDEAGAPLANAQVIVTDTRTGNSQEFTTGSDGLFTARNLATGGPYTVSASAPGHQGQTVQDLMTNLQGATQLTFALSKTTAETGEQAIVVTAARARVTQLEVGPGTSFNTEVMQSAPSFNRDVRDVIRIDPRVSLDRDDGGSGTDRISCLGGNDRGNSFTVDGVLQGDIYGLNDTGFSSRSSTPVPYDAVRETQVQFAPFDVEYGQFTGCAINVVTKSGSNTFHGEAFYEYGDNDMRGNKVAGRQISQVEPDKRWGIALGGPILKDRLFFFGAYEEQKAGAPQDDGPVGAGYPNEQSGITEEQFNAISEVLSDVYGVETGPLVKSRPYSNKRLFGRLDWQINDDHRLEGTYQKLEESTVRPDDLFSGSSPQAIGGNTFYISGTESDYFSGRFYSRWTDQLSTELRYSHTDIQDLQDPVGGGEAQSGNPIPRFIIGVDNAPLGSSPTSQPIPDGAVLAGPGTSRSANDLKTKVDQFRAVANYDAGSHKLKAGFELNRADIYNLFVQNATGTLVFRNVNDLALGLLSPGTGNDQTGTQGFRVVPGQTEGFFGTFSPTGDISDAAAEFERSIYSIYAQDDWRVNDRLDLILGLRYDWFEGDSPELNDNFVERYGFGNDTGFSDVDGVLLPRLAFRYDVGDWGITSSTRVQGGIGVFSGGDPVVWFGNAFQNNGQLQATATSQAAGCPGGQIDVVTGGVFTGVPQCVVNAGIANAQDGLGDTQSVDPDIKMPTVVRFNLGLQTNLDFQPTGFFSGWRLNADYIYSYYRNPFTIVDLSQTPDIRKGLNGYTSDGRPIYASIDPTVAGCDAVFESIGPAPRWSNVSAACFNTTRDDELTLTNADGYDSHVASAFLSKYFDRGIFTEGGSSYFTIGYAFTAASDRRNMYNSTAGSNYDLTAAADRQNPEESRGFFGSRHNITFSGNFKETFFSDLATSFGFTLVARSGRPYSLTFSGSGIFNDSASGENNALLYIPSIEGMNDPNVSPLSNASAVQQLVDFARNLDCAKEFLGETIKRNTCQNDWYFDLDLRLSQELPGPASLFGFRGIKDKITAYLMFDNFLNFIDNEWNVQHRRNFSGLQDLIGLTTTGIDSEGRYIFAAPSSPTAIRDDFRADNGINTSSSVWRLKAGISYKF